MKFDVKPDYVVTLNNDNYYIYIFTVEGELEKAITSINKVNNGLNRIVQIVKCDSVLSLRQLVLAVYHTIKSFKKGRNIARKPYLELLLRLSGQKQIKNALESIGLPPKATKACLIMVLHEDHKGSLQELLCRLKSLNIKLTRDSKEYPIVLAILKKGVDPRKILDVEKEHIAKSALLDLL